MNMILLWEMSGHCFHHSEDFESFTELWVSSFKFNFYVLEYFTCMCMPGIQVAQKRMLAWELNLVPLQEQQLLNHLSSSS